MGTVPALVTRRRADWPKGAQPATTRLKARNRAARDASPHFECKDPHFIASETPSYIGRAVAALAADPNVLEKSGQALSTWGLSEEYGFTDIDGRQPHWGRYYAQFVSH